jgi:carbamoyl-phosphate synthase large subunit
VSGIELREVTLGSVESRANRINVLFTSVGRRVELMRAFKQAYQELALAGSIVATDIDPLAPALRDVDRYHIVPAVDDPGYIPALERICERESIDLIFPLIDPDIPVLASHREQLERHGARLAVVDERVAGITHDKWMTHAFFASIDAPTPRAWDGIPQEDIDFPLFVKPRVGSAGQGATRVNSREQLESALAEIPQPIVQEFLPGPEVTNDVSCSLEGEVWSIVNRKRIEVRWGEVAKGVTIHDPEITANCLRIAQALETRGPITVQCIFRGETAYFTEVNARFGGGLPLAIAAGVPSPRWYLAEAAGMRVEPPPMGSYQVGLHLTRYDQSYILTESEIDEAQSHRLRS